MNPRILSNAFLSKTNSFSVSEIALIARVRLTFLRMAISPKCEPSPRILTCWNPSGESASALRHSH